MVHPLCRAVLLAIILCSAFSSAVACKCTGTGSVKSGVEASAVVFTGMVLKVEYFGLAETINPDSLAIARTLSHESSKNFLDTPMVLKATMLVTSEFKGVVKHDTVVVYTGIRGASCGFRFEVNKEYTVYGTNDNYLFMFLRVDRQRFKTLGKKGTFWTSICSRTTITVGQEQGLLNEYLGRK